MGVRIGELNSLINTIKKEAEVSKKEFIQGKKDCDREVWKEFRVIIIPQSR